MNQTKIRKLAHKAAGGWLSLDAEGEWRLSEKEVEKFAELIVRECAQVARNTDLEDVEGGDSAVLRAAGEQIQKHFGFEE